MNRPALHFDRFVLDLDSGELTDHGQSVPLAALPSRLLRYLGMNRHRTVSKAELLQEVWGGTAVGESALHQALKQARHAVGDSGRQQSVIKTMSGIGYRFAADVIEHRSKSDTPGPYVGRSALRQTLERRVDAAAGHRGGVVLIQGEPGIGKSRTCDELLAYAATQGILDVRGGGDPGAGAPPFWPWIEVFRQLAESRPVDELRRGAQALLDPAAVPLASDSGEAERFRTFDIANRCLQRAATLGPMVVVLEDLHEASAATLELLSFVARSVERTSILLVGTYREPELRRDPSRARVLSQLVSLRSVTTHELTTLSEHETAYLIEQRAERRLPSALVRVLARSSAGNPLFAVELAQLLSDSAGPLASESDEPSEQEWEQRIPLDAGRLLSDRLAALTPLARHALRAAAAIGSTFDRDLLARVDPGYGSLAVLEEALELRLVVEADSLSGMIRFSHALIRDALSDELAKQPDRARQTHLAIAEALLAGAVPRETEAAFHLCEAAPLGGIERTVAFVRRAAERAAAVGDADSAWSLYRRACGLLEKDASRARTRCELLVEAGEIAVRGPHSERARGVLADALVLARELNDGELFCRAALAHAHDSRTISEADDAVVALLEEGLDRLGDGSRSLRAQVRARLAREVFYQPRGLARALELTERAVEDARECDDPSALARVLEDVTFVRWSGGDPAGWLALNREIVSAATRAGDTDLRFRGLKGLATAYLEIGDRSAAEREIERCAQAAEEYPSPYLRTVTLNLRAAQAFLDGDFGAGERRAIEAAASGLPAARTASSAQLYYHRFESGRAVELEEALRALIAESPAIRAWRFALARVLVDLGRNDEARGVIEAAGDLDAIPRDRNWLIGFALLAECLASLPDDPLAEDVFERLRPYARLNVVLGNGSLFFGNTSHFLGLLAARGGRTDEARQYFEAAMAMHERMKTPPWVTRTQVEQAELHARLGEVERACSLATGAEARARALGMPGSVLRARAIMGKSSSEGADPLAYRTRGGE